MSAGSGKSRVVKTQQAKGRRKSTTPQQVIARAKALRRLKTLLANPAGISEEVLTILARFPFHLDELTEAGIAYEVVRALERRHPNLLS